jgi:dihydrofolate reductase
VATGRITADACYDRHRSDEFLAFLKRVAKAHPRVPPGTNPGQSQPDEHFRHATLDRLLGKQGPELLGHRLAMYEEEQRMVFGANTHRQFAQLLTSSTEDSEVRDPWVTRMWNLPATVVSTTLEERLDWPNATVARSDAVDVVARLKKESEVPSRSHGSLSMNRALMGAGLVYRVQVTLFPVVTGQTGLDPIFHGAADFDLELIESRTLDANILELIYRLTLHH